jgi:putative aminopeptidase FrvX
MIKTKDEDEEGNGAKELVRIIASYADIPVASGQEKMLRPTIDRNFEGFVDKKYFDNMGNFYALKKGNKQGLVLLSAHQDKIVRSNPALQLVRNQAGTSNPGDNYLIDRGCFDCTDTLDIIELMKNKGLHLWIRGELMPASLSLVQGIATGNVHEEFSRREKELEKIMAESDSISAQLYDLKHSLKNHRDDHEDDIAQIVALSQNSAKLKEQYSDRLLGMTDFLLEHTRVKLDGRQKLPEVKAIYAQTWPKLTVHDDGKMTGKLDDALGLGIITHLMRSVDPKDIPDILTVFTVGEEHGFTGARYASQSISNFLKEPSRGIVIDTTAYGELGAGAAIYSTCGGVLFNPDFVSQVYDLGVKNKIPCAIVKPHTVNDSSIFENMLRSTSMLAIEPPIEGIHSGLETTTEHDVIATYKLLEAYLTQGDFSVLPKKDYAVFKPKDKAGRGVVIYDYHEDADDTGFDPDDINPNRKNYLN